MKLTSVTSLCGLWVSCCWGSPVLRLKGSALYYYEFSRDTARDFPSSFKSGHGKSVEGNIINSDAVV